jgi:iron(III) transport system ATP-binding protein
VMWLDVKGVGKRYGDKVVLDDLSFSLKIGDIACLLGSSGSGKTTALRAIAGFEQVERGQISLGEQVVCDERIFIAAHERNVGMVFQDHALFPHLTVADNIAFGLSGSKAHKQQRVEQLLDLIHLPQHAQSYPHELSGGQQQRVALARSLAPRPKLLLLDEPFSSLDVELRERLAREVREILKAEGVTALMVTHDQQEAFAMADVVGVMNHGRIEQWDAPYPLYHEPKTRYVADFIGQGVFMTGVAENDTCIDLELGHYCGKEAHGFTAGQTLNVLIRPDDVVHDDQAEQTAVVKSKIFRGTDFIYTLILPSGQEVLAQVPSHHRHDVGEAIGIYLDLDHLIAFA